MFLNKKVIKKFINWDLVKYLLTAFILILVPVYLYYYGLQNFLWLSDIGLFLTLCALWTKSDLIMSMAAVGVLFVELAWSADFFVELIFGINLIHLSDYMFDSSYPIVLRLLSLFHIVTPIIWVLYILQYGYNKRAVYYFTLLYWASLFMTYFFTDHKANISWVFFPEVYNTQFISELSWVIFLIIGFPVFIFLPTDYILRKVFKLKN